LNYQELIQKNREKTKKLKQKFKEILKSNKNSLKRLFSGKAFVTLSTTE